MRFADWLTQNLGGFTRILLLLKFLFSKNQVVQSHIYNRLFTPLARFSR